MGSREERNRKQGKKRVIRVSEEHEDRTGEGAKAGKEKKEIEFTEDMDRDAGIPSLSLSDLSLKNAAMVLTRSRYAQLLLFLTLSGALLRFYNLGYNSLWLDEAVTHDFAIRPFLETWGMVAGGEVNPPLFYWIERLMLSFGDNEFILRFAPAICGIVTIPLFYLLGKELVDRNVGIIAAAFLAFSPFHLFYSQEARAYSMMLLFFSLALLFFIRGTKDWKTKDWGLFGLFGAIAFWVHFYVLVPLGVLFLFGIMFPVIERPFSLERMKKIFLSLGVFILASLPLLTIIYPLFAARSAAPPTWGYQGISLLYETLLQMSGYNPLLMACFLVLFFAGVSILFLHRPRYALLLVGLLFLPFAASLPLSHIMPMMPRYLIYLLPAFFLGISLSVRLLNQRARMSHILICSIALIFLVNLPILSMDYTSPQKDDWRGFAGILGESTQAGDVVVVVPEYIRFPLDYYYDNATDGTIEYGATRAKELQEIETMHQTQNLFYVVTGDIIAANPELDALEWLEKNARQMAMHGRINFLVSGR